VGNLTVRESRLQLINYVMIALILVALPLHFATHAFLGVASQKESLTYDSVIERYRSVATMTVLAMLLTGASYHGLYGLRKILLEVSSGPRWNRAVTTGIAVAGIIILGWGLRTIVLVVAGA
jgi:succinate dehydrogenase hydrophobic anchor subunit